MFAVVDTFSNEKIGLSAVIKKVSTGFSVSVRDDECDEYLDSSRTYSTIEVARVRAKEAVNMT